MGTPGGGFCPPDPPKSIKINKIIDFFKKSLIFQKRGGTPPFLQKVGSSGQIAKSTPKMTPKSARFWGHFGGQKRPFFDPKNRPDFDPQNRPDFGSILTLKIDPKSILKSILEMDPPYGGPKIDPGVPDRYLDPRGGSKNRFSNRSTRWTPRAGVQKSIRGYPDRYLDPRGGSKNRFSNRSIRRTPARGVQKSIRRCPDRYTATQSYQISEHVFRK